MRPGKSVVMQKALHRPRERSLLMTSRSGSLLMFGADDLLLGELFHVLK